MVIDNYIFTEEPDAFETESEQYMNKELEEQLDKEIKKIDDEENKYVKKFEALMNQIKKKMDITYYTQGKKAIIGFPTKCSYKIFYTRYKKAVNAVCEYGLDSRYFEQLNKDYAGLRYIVVKLK